MSEDNPFDSETAGAVIDANAPSTSDPFAGTNITSSSSLPELSADTKEETAQSKWDVERARELLSRREDAEKQKQQLAVTAKDDIAKFYADKATELERKKKSNRNEETNFRAELKQLFQSGPKWEKVTRLVNLQPRVADKGGVSRTERFRKLLIQLKASKDPEEQKE